MGENMADLKKLAEDISKLSLVDAVELKNILKYGHIPIYPNLRIAQLSFWEYSENAQRPYRGRYFGDTKVSMVKDGADVLRTQ